MKTFALAAIAAVAAASVAAPAVANDQLARTLGVEPGAYSTVELIQLRQAVEEQDSSRINYILSDAAEVTGTTPNPQFARSVDAPGASISDIQVILSALEENDSDRARFQAGGDVVSTQSFGVTAGQRQLAATLGVDAAAYSVAELIQLREMIENTGNAS